MRRRTVHLAVLALAALVATGVLAPDPPSGHAGSALGARPAAAATVLPALTNRSGLADARATALAAEALAGLGFAPGAPDGPQAEDRVVVTPDFVAWIDETGFYGKLNGLWWLSPTASGDRSFTVRDATGRPVNQLVVGERGDGRWPKGYRGAEHIEMPNNVPEPGDAPGCATAWCSQFSLDEAPAITQIGIPWWRSCGAGQLGWTDHATPIEVTDTGTAIRLVYEAPLHKMADGGGAPFTGASCHADWLFPDGVRRTVYLRVGYELHYDGPVVDRLLQVRNPAGNPPFAGPFSFIGGFVLTSWPAPYPGKELNQWVLPEDHDVGDPYLARTLVGGQWNPGFPQAGGPDVAFGWLAQPVDLGAGAALTRGSGLRLSNVGPADNLDVGFCLCVVHGGLEMGGGLLHSVPATDAALPVAGGSLSIEARRRLETGPAQVIPDPPTTTTASTTTSSTSTSSTTSTTSTTTVPTTTAVTAPATAATPVVATPALTG